MNKEEFLKQDKIINQVYKETEDYGRMQFVRKIVKLQNNWNELKECLKEEIIECKAVINTILPEFEKIMPRSSGKTLLTNEYNRQQTIIKVFEVMLSKMKEIEGGENDDSSRIETTIKKM